jgi:hypothetical protein
LGAKEDFDFKLKPRNPPFAARKAKKKIGFLRRPLDDDELDELTMKRLGMVPGGNNISTASLVPVQPVPETVESAPLFKTPLPKTLNSGLDTKEIPKSKAVADLAALANKDSNISTTFSTPTLQNSKMFANATDNLKAGGFEFVTKPKDVKRSGELEPAGNNKGFLPDPLEAKPSSGSGNLFSSPSFGQKIDTKPSLNLFGSLNAVGTQNETKNVTSESRKAEEVPRSESTFSTPVNTVQFQPSSQNLFGNLSTQQQTPEKAKDLSAAQPTFPVSFGGSSNASATTGLSSVVPPVTSQDKAPTFGSAPSNTEQAKSTAIGLPSGSTGFAPFGSLSSSQEPKQTQSVAPTSTSTFPSFGSFAAPVNGDVKPTQPGGLFGLNNQNNSTETPKPEVANVSATNTTIAGASTASTAFGQAPPALNAIPTFGSSGSSGLTSQSNTFGAATSISEKKDSQPTFGASAPTLNSQNPGFSFGNNQNVGFGNAGNLSANTPSAPTQQTTNPIVPISNAFGQSQPAESKPQSTGFGGFSSFGAPATSNGFGNSQNLPSTGFSTTTSGPAGEKSHEISSAQTTPQSGFGGFGSGGFGGGFGAGTSNPTTFNTFGSTSTALAPQDQNSTGPPANATIAPSFGGGNTANSGFSAASSLSNPQFSTGGFGSASAGAGFSSAVSNGSTFASAGSFGGAAEKSGGFAPPSQPPSSGGFNFSSAPPTFGGADASAGGFQFSGGSVPQFNVSGPPQGRVMATPRSKNRPRGKR